MKCKKKKIFLVLLLVVCGAFCYGEQVCFQIVQHNNSADKVSEEALVVEDALISSFFENGFIVTNSPAEISRDNKGDKKLWTLGMQDSVNGGCDYFIQVILHFTQKDNKSPLKDLMILNKVEYNLSSVTPVEVRTNKSWNCELEIIDADDLSGVSESLINEIIKEIMA